MTADSPVAAPPAPLDHADDPLDHRSASCWRCSWPRSTRPSSPPRCRPSARELGDVEHLPWVVTAYLLTATAVTPLYGKLSDIHGRRVMLLVAIAHVRRSARSPARWRPHAGADRSPAALQGLGGGGLISLAQTIIADIVSPRERGRYQGYIAGVFVASSIGRAGARRLPRRALCTGR